jgi:hypothetical protein
MQPEQITAVGTNTIKVSVPQPTDDTFYDLPTLIRLRDQAQVQVDYYNNLISQAQALGIK